jgi:hypothetical protein
MLRNALPILLAAAVCLSCKQAPTPQEGRPASAGPQKTATVVTINTTIEPAKKTHTHKLVIMGDRARNMGEVDTWHLYDADKKTITFVDDVAKTYRVEKLDDAMKERRTAYAAALPAHYPRLTFRRTGTKKPLQGANAEQAVIEGSGYRRELWLAEHPAIPKGLFAMMHASERPSSPLAPMMRAVDDALLSTRGFPLADRAEITYGNQKMIVERTVTAVQQQQIAESALRVPRDYKDLTPKPAPAKKKKK